MRDKTTRPTECPICHGSAFRFKSKEYGPFWKCQKAKCGALFPDMNGKLVQPVQCPKCGKPSLHQYTSQKLPGTTYWGCRCGAFFADEHGFPGEAFREEEKAPCPSCSGQAVRRIYIEGPRNGEWYWHCECGDHRDIDGQIGPRYDEAIQ